MRIEWSRHPSRALLKALKQLFYIKTIDFISVPAGTTLMTAIFFVRVTKPMMILTKMEQRFT